MLYKLYNSKIPPVAGVDEWSRPETGVEGGSMGE